MSISSRFLRISLLAAAACGLVTISCGHPSSGGSGGTTGTGGTSNCTPGEELCSCMSGNACNPGLACADDINKCVTVNTSGTGGTTATGGSPGSGGSTGSGGVVGTGGTVGSGGSSATGGSTGSGGSSATGGSMGTGGGSAGPNLVTNGDLSQGDSGWNIGQGSPSSSGVMNGQYCATFGGGTVLIGWGNGSMAANLMSGKSYKLSYQASSSNGSGTSLEIHIGQAVAPYNSDISNPITGDSLQSSPMTFTHTFMSTATDSTAGIAFLFTANGGNTTVCVDNLTVTAN